MAEVRAEGGRRTPRRRWIVGVVAALLAGIVVPAVTSSPQAQAAIFNLYPSDDTGVFTDLFFDADAIYAFVTTDLRGGAVCLIDADAHPASCDGGRYTVSVGNFYRGPVPIAAPLLAPGEYRLMGDTGIGLVGTRLSEPFTVAPCDADCDGADSPEAQSELKRMFTEHRRIIDAGTRAACAGMVALATISTAKMVADAMQVANLGLATVGGGVMAYPMMVGLSAAGALTLVYSFLQPAVDPNGNMIIPDDGTPSALISAIWQTVTCKWLPEIAHMLADPPDPNYQTVATAEVLNWVPTGDATLDAITRNFELARASDHATIIAYERYQGALLDNELGYAHAQLRAVADNESISAAALRDASRLIRTRADQLATDPSNVEPRWTADMVADCGIL